MLQAKSNPPKLMVVMGAGGNLAREKLIRALWTCDKRYRKEGQNPNFKVLGVDPTPIPDPESYLVQFAKPRTSPTLAEGFAEFADRFDFVQNGRDDSSYVPMFDNIVQFMQEHSSGEVIIYLAVPYSVNIPIMKQFKAFSDQHDCSTFRFLFEKPAEISIDAISQLKQLILDARIREDNVGIVEHFYFKPGVINFINSAYPPGPYNEALKGAHISDVVLTVQEAIGSAGRAYPGIMVDSIFNHSAFLESIILGNPVDNGWDGAVEKMTSNLERLAYLRRKSDDEEANLKRYDRFREAIKARGAYACCHQDLQDSAVPTGVILEFYPPNNRWGGETRFTLQHMKNTPIKANQVEFFFNAPKDRLGTMWRYHFEKVDLGERFYGWECFNLGSRGGTTTVRRTHSTDLTWVEPDQIDGYPDVVRNVLEGDMSRFMSLAFQETSIRAFAPWADRLDKTAIEDRIWFHQGQDPFRTPNFSRDSLVELL